MSGPVCPFLPRLLLALSLSAAPLLADSVPVRHPQGSAHGFVAVETLDGKRIATGDMTQVLRGDRVVSRLTLRFRDGSLDDDTTVFTQHGVFHLLSDHHVQHGPSFPKAADVLIDAAAGRVKFSDDKGNVTEEIISLPDDLSNGLPPNLLMNLIPTDRETRLSFVAVMGKPRLVHVSVKPTGKVAFRVGGLRKEAVNYTLHVELGGIAGVVAPLIGKQPEDYHIWILPGVTPAFIREEGPLYIGGPTWRIEQISPSFHP